MRLEKVRLVDLVVLIAAGIVLAGSVATNIYTQILLRECHDLIWWRLEHDNEENQSKNS